MRKIDVNNVIQKLETEYPSAKPMLNFTSPYELLVAVILSAQCTDERVNAVTENLFKAYNTPYKMATLSREELAEIIKPCGLNNSKSAHILDATKSIIENFAGNVPSDYDSLLTLAGVGRKTANVVYSVAFGGDAIAVDTHVFRVSNRLGLVKENSPEKTEFALMKVLPKNKWSKLHHAIIYHGRRVCNARNPKCASCVLQAECRYKNKNL